MGLRFTRVPLLSVSASLVLVSFLTLTPQFALGQVLPDTPANRARGVVGCTQTSSGISCPRGGNSGGAAHGGVSFEEVFAMGAINAVQGAINEYQRIRRERSAQAYRLNQTGNDYWARGKIDEAAAQYRLALQYSPRDSVIANNLRRTAERIEQRRQSAIRSAELKVSEREVGDMLDDLASRWGTSDVPPNDMDFTSYQPVPADNTLQFVSLKEPLFSRGTKQSAPVDLSFNEGERQPVVDPRVVKGQMTADEAAALRKQEVKVEALTTLAAVFVGEGRYDEAIEYLKVAEETNPDQVGIKKAIGYTLYLRDTHSGAVKTSPKAEYLLDALEHGAGDWQSSVDYLTVLHQEDPNNLPVRDALDFTDGISGYYVDPAELRVPTDRGTPPPPTAKVMSLRSQGIASIQSKQFELAYDSFRKAHELSPNDFGIRSVMNYSEGLWAAQQAE